MAQKKAAPKHKTVFGKDIVTPKGILMFPTIARPEAFQEGQADRYSATIILNKGDKLKALLEQIDEVGIKAFGDKYKDAAVIRRPYLSGEEVIAKILDRHEGDDEYQISEGTMKRYTDRVQLAAHGAGDKEAPKCYLAARSVMPRRPGNEADLQAIEQQFYGGAFVRLAVTPFSYVTGANRGVGLIFKGVQFVADGERIGGADLDSAFGTEVEEEGGWDEADEVSKGFEEAEDAEDANI